VVDGRRSGNRVEAAVRADAGIVIQEERAVLERLVEGAESCTTDGGGIERKKQVTT
jgi:hypothetical protein